MPYEALRPVGDDNNTNCFTTQILVSHLESKKYCQNFGKHFDDRKFRHIYHIIYLNKNSVDNRLTAVYRFENSVGNNYLV